jgi:hypothetical protein
LGEELKQVEKLAKRLRRDLLLYCFAAVKQPALSLNPET